MTPGDIIQDLHEQREALRAALAYVIRVAESFGVPIQTPEMDAARKLLQLTQPDRF